MKTIAKRSRFLACALLAAFAIAGEAQAGVSCHNINAMGVGQDLGNGQTVATIKGGGLLNGTTAGNFAIVGGAPPVFNISGTVTFTVNKATLTVTVAGTFDVSTGEFGAAGPVTSATGKLADATGSLALEGIQDLSDGSFVETVTGTICADLSP